MSFDKLFYKGKEVKSEKSEFEFMMFELKMPKKLKGTKTIFPVSFGYDEHINVTVDNDPRITKIVVYVKIKK